MSDIKVIDEHTLRGAIELVARKFPSRVNNNACQYTDNDGKHCIIGQALADLGLPVPDRQDYEINGLPFDAYDLLGWFRGNDVEFTADAVEYGRRVQHEADGYIAWKHCVPWGCWSDAR